jgi:aspartate aminotransferase
LGVASDAKPTKDAPVQLTSELFGYGDETSFACEEGPYLVTVAADEEAYLVLPVRVTVEKAGGTVREVKTSEGSFMPDLSAIESAITERTAALIINSPNNPTGAVYPEDVLIGLAELLTRKERELGKTIYLISDEPYRELVYDGIAVPYPQKYYDDTVICYSFSKSLSLPGERIGYILVSPRARDFSDLYAAICGAGRALGFVCAPSLLQKLIPSCLGKTADLAIYDGNRRTLYDALTEYGYELTHPDGAFYLFVKAPGGDANAFSEAARRHELLLVPGDDFGAPGYVRIAYCVEPERIKRSLPAFRALIKEYERKNS